MFNSIFSLGNLFSSYSGSPLVAAVSSATCTVNGQIAPCSDAFNFLMPLLAVLLPLLFVWMLVAIAVGVLMIISWWKIFEKAGRHGWAAIIPVYNSVVMLQITNLSPWFLLLALIPFLGSIALFVVMIIMNIRLAKVFGKDEGFAVGLILLPYVFLPILAFGQAKFVGLTPIVSSTPTV